MALTVGDIMERDPVTARPEGDGETVVRVLRTHEVPGVPVVNDGGRPIGIVTEADLVLTDDDGDLHLPHYIEPMGGVVFLEPPPPPPALTRARGRVGFPRAAPPLRVAPAQGRRAEGQGPDDRGPDDDRGR